jgi:archaellum component FlaC
MAEGFFYPVKAIVDKQSFEQGKQELEKLATASKSIIGGLVGIGGALVGVATGAGLVAQQELRLSNAIGVSTEAMSSFKIACGMAGVSSNGLISSLSQLESKMQKLKIGSVDNALAQNLGMLGIDYQSFAGMSSEQRMSAVFTQAGKMDDQKLAAEMVGDVLGQAGKDYYQSLQLSGKSLSQQLAEAKKLNFTSSQNRKEGAAFMSELNGIKEASKSITMLLGSEIASKLTPLAQQIKRFLMNNRQNIIKGIHGIAESIEVFTKGISGAIEKIAPVINNLITNFGGLDTVLIRVGVAFASLKLAQISGSVLGLIKNIKLLKSGLSGFSVGLGFTALYLLFDDIITHYRGGRSVFGWLIDNADEIKAKIKTLLGDENYAIIVNTITKAINELKKAFDDLKKVLPEVGKLWLNLFVDAISGSLTFIGQAMTEIRNAITWFKNLKEAWDEGGVKGALSFMSADKQKKQAEYNDKLEQRKNTLAMQKYNLPYEKLAQKTKDMLDIEASKQLTAEQAYNFSGGTLNKGVYELGATLVNSWNKLIGKEDSSYGVDTKRAERDYAYKLWADEYIAEQKEKDKKKPVSIKDGIVEPSGRVIGIDPNDWVFALKNLDSLSSAILPPSVANQSVNAPANYVINQTFNVSGNVRPEVIKENAYMGTSQALQNSLQNATRIMQFMPGTK